MAGALRKTMLYLGLAEEERHGQAEDYVDEYDEEYAVPQDHEAEVTPIHRGAVRPVPDVAPSADLRRITTIHPRSYNDARVIGEAFRSGTPVIINLSEMTDADAKRLVDFSAGLIFGLRGTIERVTSKVFLLSPEHVEVTGEDDVAGGEDRAGFFNQS
ncbi:cell division protein SepF [Cellulomonas bogoriensis]|uniref:Cell division protein SepF n=1 Tax=Cellulomonas bogoriensis 69B4 = DSM 16987 TaxID=1386082 RepID=A0A0A0BL30_9CELL|nr:cell division protein SepF [Cellulomonas bogoriensis]KGM09213.1 cell division protein SepF [Cellulomonas bogoriensis 69B4 = DSM 16987]